MAQSTRFVCSHCSYAIESWSDGNPYYFNEHGDKVYAYHPDSAGLARCIGNDIPSICLDCGAVFKIDSNGGERKCPQCQSESVVDTHALKNKTCPRCHTGTFSIDPNFFCVS